MLQTDVILQYEVWLITEQLGVSCNRGADISVVRDTHCVLWVTVATMVTGHIYLVCFISC